MISLQVGKLRPGEVLDAKVRLVAQAATFACRLFAGLTYDDADTDFAHSNHMCTRTNTKFNTDSFCYKGTKFKTTFCFHI